MDAESKTIEVMIDKKGIRLPISRMGAGLQQVLYLISNIVFNEKRIIGIEEIELNLSPQAQKDVFEMVKTLVQQEQKLVSQVLVTSHSPYFQNRNDVSYYSVTYDQDEQMTKIESAPKGGLKKYFEI